MDFRAAVISPPAGTVPPRETRGQSLPNDDIHQPTVTRKNAHHSAVVVGFFSPGRNVSVDFHTSSAPASGVVAGVLEGGAAPSAVLHPRVGTTVRLAALRRLPAGRNTALILNIDNPIARRKTKGVACRQASSAGLRGISPRPQLNLSRTATSAAIKPGPQPPSFFKLPESLLGNAGEVGVNNHSIDTLATTTTMSSSNAHRFEYDDEDRRLAAVKVQSIWRGHIFRIKLWVSACPTPTLCFTTVLLGRL